MVEEVENAEILGPGVKGRAFVTCIGWKSREHHTTFRTTKECQELLPLLKGEPVELEVHHTAFQETGKEKELSMRGGVDLSR